MGISVNIYNPVKGMYSDMSKNKLVNKLHLYGDGIRKPIVRFGLSVLVRQLPAINHILDFGLATPL